MRPITLYTAPCRGNAKNIRYREKRVITNIEEFKEAMRHDHVCAEYRGSHRSVAISSLRTASFLTATIRIRITRLNGLRRRTSKRHSRASLCISYTAETT